MKVVIFAGGWGTRLGQMAERIPKPMVLIGDRPILWHVMSAYARHGFRDFVICLGVKGDVIRDWFHNFHTYRRDFTVNLATGRTTVPDITPLPDWNVTLAETGLHALKGARLKKVERYLDGDDHFLTYGDGIADVDVTALLDFHRRHGKLLTITGVHPPSRFGEVEESEGRVISFQEKPESGRCYINGGFMVFRRRLLDFLTSDDGCDFELGAVRELAQRDQVMMYRHDGRWACVDHERDVHHLQSLLEEGRAWWTGGERAAVAPARLAGAGAQER